MKRKCRSITVAPGPIVRQLTQGEVTAAIEQWLSRFGQSRGTVDTDSFLWHVFSFGSYPSVSRAPALEKYHGHQAVEYVVVSNERDEGFITSTRPTETSLLDWLVFPMNFAWTMVFTHEDEWLGPFFAEGPSYRTLNAANVQACLTRYGRRCKAGQRQCVPSSLPGLTAPASAVRVNSNVRPQVSRTYSNARHCLQVLAVQRLLRGSSISRRQGSRLWLTRSNCRRWQSQQGYIAALRQHLGSAFKTRVSTVEA